MLKVSTVADQTKSPKAGGEHLTQDEGFKELRRRKRHNTDEAAQTSKKAAVQEKTPDALNALPKEVVTPLRTTNLDTNTSGTEAMPHEEAVPGKSGTPPPIVPKLQKQLKDVVIGQLSSVAQETWPE